MLMRVTSMDDSASSFHRGHQVTLVRHGGEEGPVYDIRIAPLDNLQEQTVAGEVRLSEREARDLYHSQRPTAGQVLRESWGEIELAVDRWLEEHGRPLSQDRI